MASIESWIVWKAIVEFAKTPSAKQLAKKIKVGYDVFWTNTLKDYHKKTTDYLADTKTLIYRHKSVKLNDIYVPAKINIDGNTSKKKQIDAETHIWEQIVDGKKLVISGMAGSGKSMLLKRLFLTFPGDSINKIPIFFQLRNMGEGAGLSDCLLAELQVYQSQISKAHFDLAMSAGIFCLLLDGFDEVDPDHRSKVEAEVLQIARKYVDVPIILTSRPDENFDSWQKFSIVGMAPLDQAAVLALADKIEINRPKIEQFKREVKGGLFQSHRQFMQNPLLATMLILVFCEGNSIPDEAHLFYERAYEVLSLQHDGLKELYTRRFHSHLSPDELRKLLEVFSYVTFTESMYAIPKEMMHAILKKCLIHIGYQAEESKIVKDFCESLSILFLEGRRFHYIHRSFQEYFTAYFLLFRVPDQAPKLVRQLFFSLPSQYSIELAMQMNRRFMIHSVMKPWVAEVYSRVADLDPSKDTVALLRVFFAHWDPMPQDMLDTRSEKTAYSLVPHTEDEIDSFTFVVLVTYTHFFEKLYGIPSLTSLPLLGRAVPRKRNNITQAFVNKHPELVTYAKDLKSIVERANAELEKEKFAPVADLKLFDA